MVAKLKPEYALKAPHWQVATDMQTADRHEWIATYAYYLAEARGFTPGFALDDWLEAERAYDELNRLFVSFSLQE